MLLQMAVFHFFLIMEFKLSLLTLSSGGYAMNSQLPEGKTKVVLEK